MWLTNLTTVDPATRTTRSQSMRIADGRIAELNSSCPDPLALDLGGRFVGPGLVTCHVHLTAVYPFNPDVRSEAPAAAVLRAAARATEALLAGVTTLRTVGDNHGADLALARSVAARETTGPRVVPSGAALTAPGGHGDELFGGYVASGASAFAEGARRQLEAGAQHVKIFITGGIADAGEDLDAPQMTAEEITAVVNTAAGRAAYVVAHAGGSGPTIAAARLGVRSFEHGYFLDEAACAELAVRGCSLGLTLAVSNCLDWMLANGMNPGVVQRAADIRERHMFSAGLAIAAGVSLVHSTDLPPGGASGGTSVAVREIELLQEAGLHPWDALRAATVNGAELMGLANVGRVRVGDSADLVAMPADPTADVSALRGLDLVIAGGHVVRDDAGLARPSRDGRPGRMPG